MRHAAFHGQADGQIWAIGFVLRTQFILDPSTEFTLSVAERAQDGPPEAGRLALFCVAGVSPARGEGILPSIVNHIHQMVNSATLRAFRTGQARYGVQQSLKNLDSCFRRNDR